MKRRNVVKLKIWMLEAGLKQTDIARETGEDRSYTTKTINGSRHNKKVLQYLLDRGCPESYLAPLPKDLTEKEEKRSA